MITIKNRDELKKYLNKDKDLILPKENITLEFTITRDDVRNIECRNLVACKDDKYFDINAGNINALNIYARNIDALNINAENIDAENIDARNINARNINAWNIDAWNIYARNIDALNINAENINARNIDARNIDALNIYAENIIAWNISYYAFCTSYTSIKCKSWVKRYEKGKDPICLDGELIIDETERNLNK